jgi:PAS domain S-box-containing protein
LTVDALGLQLASALQRFTTLQRRAETHRDNGALTTRALAELGTALEEIRVAQEQLIENRRHMEALQAELAAQAAKYWDLFDEMPEAYVVTRPDTTILEVNRAAADLFNVSQRFLAGKTLSVFVCEDRGRFLDESGRIAQERTSCELRLKLRPRERAPMAITARVRGDGTGLRWILRSTNGINSPLPTEPPASRSM